MSWKSYYFAALYGFVWDARSVSTMHSSNKYKWYTNHTLLHILSILVIVSQTIRRLYDLRVGGRYIIPYIVDSYFPSGESTEQIAIHSLQISRICRWHHAIRLLCHRSQWITPLLNHFRFLSNCIQGLKCHKCVFRAWISNVLSVSCGVQLGHCFRRKSSHPWPLIGNNSTKQQIHIILHFQSLGI